MKSKADVLVICKADYKEHLGEFSCTARNSLGNKTAKAKVEILAPPVIKPFSEIKPEISLEFTLFCDADGNPKPTVWWTKFDDTTSNFSPFENRSNVLYFASFEEGNSGTYRCYAQNGLNITSEDHELAFVVDVSPIKAPLKADSNKTPMVVGGISFFIILSLVVVVAVILYKRKKHGGFYILTMPPLTDYIKS
ncbi:peroxidasin-like [Xenia sp. Carnegie-2017]|uniref:peroxidasin-like n=1 Tax=Xenia sp. Carnegie-2017 TaxID=2897299 RepID=UPI001F03A1B6|nr:peroxidasin-like [Xenia sp. Carnegie-2017]